MALINTVLGPIHPDSLGTTLVHEHLVIGFPGWDLDPLAGTTDRKHIVETCLKALKPAKDLGLRSLIDATPPDLSREVEIMREVSERAEINVICATGRYDEEKGTWTYLKFKNQGDMGAIREELYEGFMREVTSGIGPLHIKPGVVKVATGLGHISPCEEALLMAAARVSKETGIPIVTHTEDGTMGPEQAELLIGEGADPNRIMIGHMCGNQSLDYHRSVLRRGVNIAFDRFGVDIFVSDAARLATLVALLREGHAENIMLSHDHVSATFGRGVVWPTHLLPQTVNWSFSHIFKAIIPALKQEGIEDETIRTMIHDNPRRLFEGTAE